MNLPVWFAHDAVGNHGGWLHRGHLLQEALNLQPDFLDRVEVGAFDLDPHGCPHAALEHDDPGRYGL